MPDLIELKLAQAQSVYHIKKLPGGDNHFYESGLRKSVSYVRLTNRIIGAVYDKNRPYLFTCFAAQIYPNKVEVNWWNNLQLIGRPNQDSLYQIYTIAEFTADNSTAVPGLTNADAVKSCIDEAP
ncbi:MAG: hypothetical protein Cpurp_04465 [Chlorogloea purpurea SAG 13.99]|nr:hypothetical protein [Chlorogloea purpurea SAG 13.99]